MVDIAAKDEDLMAAYSFIDAFSKRKTEDTNGQMLQVAAIKMGKNDLWIAATAKVIDAPLITTDKDFLHLNQTVLDVRYFKLSLHIAQTICFLVRLPLLLFLQNSMLLPATPHPRRLKSQTKVCYLPKLSSQPQHQIWRN